VFARLLRDRAGPLDSSSLGGLYHGEGGRKAFPSRAGDVLALPRREKMRLHRLLAGRAERLCGLQRKRASMALGSMTRNIRFSQVTTAEFVSRHISELFSYFGHCLHFVARRMPNALTAFLRLLTAKHRERCVKDVVHRVGHFRVHLTDLVSRSRMKKFDAAHCQFWAGRRRVLGWNDPGNTCWAHCAPKSGVVPAQHAGLKEARLHTFTT